MTARDMDVASAGACDLERSQAGLAHAPRRSLAPGRVPQGRLPASRRGPRAALRASSRRSCACTRRRPCPRPARSAAGFARSRPPLSRRQRTSRRTAFRACGRDWGLELPDRDGLLELALRQLPVGPRVPRSVLHAVRRSVGTPRPSRASAGPSRRRRRRRRRRSAVPGPRRRTRSRAVSPPSGALRPLPRTARQEKGAHSARGFPTPAAWMVKAAGTHDESIPPVSLDGPSLRRSVESSARWRTIAGSS